MLMRILGICLGLTVSCGGAVAESNSGDAARGGGGNGAIGHNSGGSASGGVASSGHSGTVGGAISSSYSEPACPAITVPEVVSECDPVAAENECGKDMGCYPITINPSHPCEAEVYQMLCLPAGNLPQWHACSRPLDCAPGMSCVVTSEGNECLKLCDPEVSTSCPKGLFCDGVDLQGIGICY